MSAANNTNPVARPRPARANTDAMETPGSSKKSSSKSGTIVKGK